MDLVVGGGGQLPTGQRRMQHPVATVVSSSAAPLGDARRLLLPRRLRRHQPQRSRSSSPELSHPSNCPSSGGASPMALLQAFNLLTPTTHTPRGLAREPDRLRITFTARADERQPARRSLRGTAEPPPEIPRVPPPRKHRDPASPPNRAESRRGPGGGRAIPPHRERLSHEEHRNTTCRSSSHRDDHPAPGGTPGERLCLAAAEPMPLHGRGRGSGSGGGCGWWWWCERERGEGWGKWGISEAKGKE